MFSFPLGHPFRRFGLIFTDIASEYLARDPGEISEVRAGRRVSFAGESVLDSPGIRVDTLEIFLENPKTGYFQNIQGLAGACSAKSFWKVFFLGEEVTEIPFTTFVVGDVPLFILKI